jgi:D-alanyl-D-alanine carboxypeptidase (penicillin-binding protein 5/6)
MRSLLQGLLLRSGNDAAVAVAEHVSGSESAFVDKMNARAQELGLTDTNFINATGLTDDLEHHSTALDLARLAEIALRNDDFAAWAGAQTLQVASLGALTNRNLLLGRYEGANGVKTGYTALAGLCLVASAERDGRLLIGVVLNSDDSTTEGSFIDATAVLDHGFDDFRLARPLRREQRALTYRWSDGAVPLVADEALARTVASAERVRWQVTVDPLVDRPIEVGQALGSADLLVDGETVDTTPLVAGRSVDPVAPDQSAPREAGGALQDALRAFARTAVINRRDPAAPMAGGT